MTDLPPPVSHLDPPVGPHPRASERFEALFATVVGPAFGIALRLTRNHSEAEDLVQQAALLAFRRLASFEPGTNFTTWFFRILLRCFQSSHQSSGREPGRVDWDDTPDLYLYARSYGAGLPVAGSDPAAPLLERLGTERVAAAIERLPEEYRLIVLLHFMDDFGYREIAEMLDCPVGTVRSRLHRGRKMLQKALWGVAEEAGIVPPAVRPGEGT